jgi:thiamine pyrophosphate-dependent acetolactate synthase large subunit-like protein
MSEPAYGSDVAVAELAALGIEHVALNPGASTRGLHESLVHAGAPAPQLALHEEICVAIAHGYAKAAGRPMAVLLHDLVGLQHATMAIFNAWIDRAPVLLLGGSGPADAARRRPWLDWIHSPRWQSLTVRDIVKWDDEPASLGALRESLRRGVRIATAAPAGPVYVAVDVGLQEARVEGLEPPPSAAPPPAAVTAPPEELERLARMLEAAEFPVLLADLAGGSRAAYDALIAIAERVGAAVVDLGGRHNFPSGHWADATDDRAGMLARADLAVCVDVRDTAWALRSEVGLEDRSSRELLPAAAKVARIGLGSLLQRGFVDREGERAVDLDLVADSAVALPQLAGLLRPAAGARERVALLERRAAAARAAARERAEREAAGDELTPAVVAAALGHALGDRSWLIANGALGGWPRRLWDWDRFGCHLGRSGGEGLGYGAGASIGAALAVRGSGTVVIDLQADGDLLYTPSALWTAAHERLALLTVVVNNRTYGKDRLHQRAVGRVRARGTEALAGVAIDIDDPPVDFAGLATSQGVEGFGPVRHPRGLAPAFERALAAVDEGRPALVDVVFPRP